MSNQETKSIFCSLCNRQIKKNNSNPHKMCVMKKRKLDFEEEVEIKIKKIKPKEATSKADENIVIPLIQNEARAKDNIGNMMNSSNVMQPIQNQIECSNINKFSKDNYSVLEKLSKEELEKFKISKEEVLKFIEDIDFIGVYFYEWQRIMVYQKIVFYGLESYNNKFYENNNSMGLLFSPFLISVNELPHGRYNSNNIVLLKGTSAEIEIEKFLSKNLKKKNVINITGPSGIGKSFALISQILKKKNLAKDVVILHIILSEKYIRDLKISLLNDIIFALSIYSEDKEFPTCDILEKKF